MTHALTPAAAPAGYGRLALLCGSVAAAIGVLILAGWWHDLAALKIAPAGTVAMKANTALAFALAGAALVLLAGGSSAPRRARAGRWLALAVVLIGALTLCQFLFGWQLGIDELLFKDVPQAVAPSGPGRMAPLTATCFVLLGLALIGIEWEPRPGLRPAEWLALITAIMSLIALGEYAIGQPVFYGFGQYTRMALLTAAIFFALSIGVLLARPTQGVVAALGAGRLGALELASYAALGLALLAVAAGGAWYYHEQEQQGRRAAEAELELIARLKVEQIARWRTERLADGAVLMDSGFFAEGVWRWMAAPRAELEETIRGRLDAMLQSNRYPAAVLVDTRGQVRLATSNKAAALQREEFQALASALRERRPVLSGLHTGPSAPRLHANLVVPLFRKVGAGLAPIGAVVLTIDAQQFLYPLIQSWPTLSPSAETLLVRRDGGDALILTDLRHIPDAALQLRIPLSRTEVPAVMAVLGKQGVFEGHDYRGVKVLSVLRAIPDSPWFMVAKIDEAEALAAWRSHAALIVAVIMALTLALAAAASMVWQKKSQYRALSRSATALRESETRLRRVIDGLGPYMFVGLMTPAGVLIEANAPALAAAGLKPEDVLGKPFEQTYWWAYSEPIQQQLRAAIERAAGGTPSRYDVQQRAAEGVLIWIDFSLYPLRDETGKIVFLVPSAIVITERKQAEEEIRDLNASLEQRVAERTRQLEEASRAKSDFLANMSHELRTPLNAIIGFSEMLKDGVLGKLEAKQNEFIADIFGAGTHLLSLINDILDLSKVEAGMLQLEAMAVDLPALLKASTMIVREKALAQRIGLDTRLDPALGTVLADERKLKQIVYNLLSNAVKFTPEGGLVTLHARRCTRAEVALDEGLPGRLIALPPGDDPEFLAITVEDSGVGIAAQDLPRLFEPFTQLESSLARRHAGTGLGLSLVRRLAELHGGTVGVASRPGTGSRFCVWLPYREVAAAAPEDRAATEAAASTPPVPTVPFAPAGAAPTRPAPPLALVIEDDDQAADLIAARLHVEGFQVMRAATAEEGLVRAAKRRPQLITLDIFLPAMDGWEFLRHLKADPRLADTPVVIISVAEGLERGLALGARRVLQKPFADEELVSALAGLIETPRSAGAPARVLVVDDNVKVVELVAGLIEREGYQALRAYGGAEAIRAARRARPDLVILDLMMPEVSGFEVARALRASENTARIPILVLTARDLTPEERAQLNDAVNAILQKSEFSHDELLAELRRAIAAPKPD